MHPWMAEIFEYSAETNLRVEMAEKIREPVELWASRNPVRALAIEVSFHPVFWDHWCASTVRRRARRSGWKIYGASCAGFVATIYICGIEQEQKSFISAKNPNLIARSYQAAVQPTFDSCSVLCRSRRIISASCSSWPFSASLSWLWRRESASCAHFSCSSWSSNCKQTHLISTVVAPLRGSDTHGRNYRFVANTRGGRVNEKRHQENCSECITSIHTLTATMLRGPQIPNPCLWALWRNSYGAHPAPN